MLFDVVVLVDWGEVVELTMSHYEPTLDVARLI